MIEADQATDSAAKERENKGKADAEVEDTSFLEPGRSCSQYTP